MASKAKHPKRIDPTSPAVHAPLDVDGRGSEHHQRQTAHRARAALADQRLDASYRLANAILGDEGQAQDAVHDAVVLAWQRWSSLCDRACFDHIVVNVGRDRLRQAARRRTTDLDDSSLSTPDATADVHRRLLVEQTLFPFTLAGADLGDNNRYRGGPEVG